MIEAKNVSKIFIKNVKTDKMIHAGNKQEFYAVKNFSFRANKGEICGILGPNGAGKTTLLRMLGKIMTPSFGEVLLYDKDGNIIDNTQNAKAEIGYLSGNTKLYERLTPREMLSSFAPLYGLDKEETNQRIESIIHVLDMEKFCDNRIEKLSTGQTQRVNISRCLIHNPQIYIFDEPTLGLDLLSSEAIIDFMKNEKEKGKTILYSTHYMEEAQYLCDRIVMIYSGEMIADGTPAKLMEETGTNNLRDTFRTLVKNREEMHEC